LARGGSGYQSTCVGSTQSPVREDEPRASQQCPILTTFVPRSREEESMIYTIIVVLIIVALVVFLMNRTRGRRGL